jgi:iron(III) transport system substrate-binding protein
MASEALVIYSGRNENLVAPLLERYSEQTGIELEVRSGSTAEMAATILEEGTNSPADVFFGQDAGALGALARLDRCLPLPESIAGRVDSRFISPDRKWVGTSGRARVLVYNTDELSPEDLPTSVFDLTDERWRGMIGWAPTNGSFQAFVTAMRVNVGEDVTRQWIVDMLANDVQAFPNNTTIVEASGRGEVAAGLVNHYYLYRFLAEDPEFPADNYHIPAGDVGSMINVAGVCIIDSSDNQDRAIQLIEYLLSDEAQQYFADETNEYPLANSDLTIDPRLQPLSAIDTPDFDLSDTEDLQGTLDLLQDTGALD